MTNELRWRNLLCMLCGQWTWAQAVFNPDAQCLIACGSKLCRMEALVTAIMAEKVAVSVEAVMQVQA